jgi:hypothetical protein
LSVTKNYFKVLIIENNLLNNTKTKFSIRVLIFIVLGLLITCYLKEIRVFKLLVVFSRPYLSILSALYYRKSIFLEIDPIIIVIWVILFLSLIILLVTKLEKLNFRLNVEYRKENNRIYSYADNNSFYRNILTYVNRMPSIVGNEMRLFLEIIFTKKGFILFGPGVAYMAFFVYFVYMVSMDETANAVFIISSLPFLFIVVFVTMVIIPLVYEVRNYFWIYRIEAFRLKKYVIIKYIFSYLLCEFSAVITSGLAIFILNVVFDLNAFCFIDWKIFGSMILLAPILPVGFGLYLGYRLPDAFFYTGKSSLNVFYSVPLIWLTSLLVAPTLLFLFWGYSANLLFYPALVFLSLLEYFLIVEFMYRKLEEKEI